MKQKCFALAAAALATAGFIFPATAPTVLAQPAPCAAAGNAGTHVIAVDAGAGAFGEAHPPAGHNWEFTDYFPRGGTTQVPVVANGDCLDFKWDGGFDSFHTVSFFTTADNPSTHPWTSKPLAVPDNASGDPAEGPNVNFAVFGPSNPSCGSNASSACDIDGSTYSNSGGNGGPAEWWTRLNVGTFTGNLWYFCLIHPGMAGYVTVTSDSPPTTTPAAEQAAAQSQYTADLAEASSAESAANTSSTTTNSDGTHTVNVTSGTGSAHTEIDEMFPGGPVTGGCAFAGQGETSCWKGNITVTAGDKVTWTYKGPKNVHTVTFPNGSGSDSVDPFKPPVCEGNPASSADTPAPNPSAAPPFGCTTEPELPFDPAPAGGTVISSASTVATAGVLGSSFSPFPQSYSFTFPNASSGLAYQCRIHDDMVGVVQVLAAAVAPAATPALPKAGEHLRPFWSTPTPTPVLAVLAALVIVTISGAAIVAVRSSN